MAKKRKILVIEIHPKSENNVHKGFETKEDVELIGKVVEMHDSKKSYKKHLKEKYSK